MAARQFTARINSGELQDYQAIAEETHQSLSRFIDYSDRLQQKAEDLGFQTSDTCLVDIHGRCQPLPDFSQATSEPELDTKFNTSFQDTVLARIVEHARIRGLKPSAHVLQVMRFGAFVAINASNPPEFICADTRYVLLGHL